MKLHYLLIALIAFSFSGLSFAEETEQSEFDTMLDGLFVDTVEEVPAGVAELSVPSSRLDDLERRIESLERTSIDAKEAEEIAERVVQRYVKEIRLSINRKEGGQRAETVAFSSPLDVQKFDLGPGETLAAYCDPSTGQMVTVGEPTTTVVSRSYSQPVPTWSTSEVVIQSQPAPVASRRTVAIRPVVQSFRENKPTQSYRRGLFGRRIPVASSSGQTCRMVNGVKVCN